jgi:hypothetical protein
MAVGHAPAATNFDSLTNTAFARMNAHQTQLMQAYNLASYPQYHWSQKDGQLLFSSNGRVKVIANVQFVGDVSKRRHTWLWAWANRAAVPSMKMDVERVRRYGERHSYPKLTTAEWKATPLDGWKMAAVAEGVLHAKGVYRSEDATGYTYLVITSIRWADGAKPVQYGHIQHAPSAYSHARVTLARSTARKKSPSTVLSSHRSVVNSGHGRGAKNRHLASPAHAGRSAVHPQRAARNAQYPRIHRT